MAKNRITDLMGVKNVLYPYLPVLVGANVDGRPNYITIGLIGWLCYDAVSVSLGHKQYTTAGIRENGTFSVNQPSSSMVRKLDYCGIYSGRRVDKAALFDNFYGELGTAPMIGECPVSLECRVIQVLERSVHAVFIGEVVGVYLDETYVTEGFVDLGKLDPLFYAPARIAGKRGGHYWTLGNKLAQAWSVGRDLTG
jgi:flavin reductase (DIM6/NTAB) family NADH-FMN oxidoreductase RutF